MDTGSLAEAGGEYVERARGLAPQIEACADQIDVVVRGSRETPGVHGRDYSVKFSNWLPGARWARIGGTPRP